MASGVFNLKQQLFALAQKAWSGQQKTNYVEYLVVAGGGAGVYGGGGAGGLLTGIVNVAPGISYTVTVGAGGTSSNGVSSVFGSITALGGGKAGDPFGISGLGSGGGGWNQLTTGVEPVRYGNGAQGTLGQGNASSVAAYFCGSGGGGAGGVGTAGVSSSAGGNGGAGIASAINGTVTVYAGGGGGYNSNNLGLGGVGGGAAGNTAYNPINGTVNTGGGGGGCDYNYSSGGSGIVIIRYPNTFADAVNSTGTKTTANSCTIYTFTSSGTITF